jgi:beta-lactamase regulating signal transducer with metallopeptidase domain
MQSISVFFPVLENLFKKYRIEREIEADKFAVACSEDSRPLIAALMKLLETPSKRTSAVAAIADYDTLEKRIYFLVNKPYLRKESYVKNFLITIISSVFLAFILFMPVYADEIKSTGNNFIAICTYSNCQNACAKGAEAGYSENPENSNLQKSSPASYTPAR